MALTKNYGAEFSGVVFTLIGLMTILASITTLGLDQIATKTIAEALSGGQRQHAYFLGKRLVVLVCLTSSVGAAVLYLLSAEISRKLNINETYQSIVQAFNAVLIFLSVQNLLSGLLKGASMPKISLLMLNGLTNLLAIIIILLCTVPANNLIYIYMVCMFVSVAIGATSYALKTRVVHISSEPSFSLIPIVLTSLPLLWVNLLIASNQWIGTLILAANSTSETVANFDAIRRTAMLVSFALVAVNGVIAPKFAVANQKGDREELHALLAWSSVIAVAIALPLTITILTVPGIVLKLLSVELALGKTVLVIVTLAQLFNAITGSVGCMLTMTGQAYYMSKATTIALLVSIVLMTSLVSNYGILGIAIASTVGVVVQNSLFLNRVRAKFGLPSWRVFGRLFSKDRFFK